jgi:hypothetical protein
MAAKQELGARARFYRRAPEPSKLRRSLTFQDRATTACRKPDERLDWAFVSAAREDRGALARHFNLGSVGATPIEETLRAFHSVS